MTTNGKKKVGRPRALDAQKKDEIIRLVNIGGSRKQAAKFVGCHHQTITDEAKRDEEFADRLTKAEGKAYAGYLTTIATAAKDGDVKAAQWMLARKYPDEFGELRKHAMTDARGRDLTKGERLRAMKAILLERFGEDALDVLDES